MSYRVEVVKKVIETEEPTSILVCDGGCGARAQYDPARFESSNTFPLGWFVVAAYRSSNGISSDTQRHFCPKCAESLLPKEARR